MKRLLQTIGIVHDTFFYGFRYYQKHYQKLFMSNVKMPEISYTIKKNKTGTFFVIKFTRKSLKYIIDNGAPYITDFIPVLIKRIQFHSGVDIDIQIDYGQMLLLEENTTKHKFLSNKLGAIDYKIYRFIIDGLITAPSINNEQIFSIIKRTYELFDN